MVNQIGLVDALPDDDWYWVGTMYRSGKFADTIRLLPMGTYKLVKLEELPKDDRQYAVSQAKRVMQITRRPDIVALTHEMGRASAVCGWKIN